MTQKMNQQIPGMIANWCKQATDRKLPEHVRYNYVVSLTVIRDYCNDAIRNYENSRKK